MSALTVARRGRLAGAIIPATALAVAGIVVAQSGAQAAPRGAALHAGPKITLGTTTNVFTQSFTEGPDGSLFYSHGSVVSVVKGNAAPKAVVHAAHTVQALAATNSDLFVETGLTVTEYRRTNFTSVRHFTLSSPVKPITEAGLIAGAGNTLWSWTDWATDESGFEFATVSQINTASSAVHVVSKFGFPASNAYAADSNGLYFESNPPSGIDLSEATSGGALHSRKVAGADGTPLALLGSRVELLVFGPHVTINTYSSSLATVSSKKVSTDDFTIASASFGLAVLSQSCTKCSTFSVSKLNPATGAASGGVKVTGEADLLSGPSADVIEVSHTQHGTVTLQRVSS
jgi:hypothetical protein